MNPFRLGLVGPGRHGERYARHLLRGEIPGAVLAAVCRRNADLGERFARAAGVPFHPDPRALVADPGVDGVIVVTPTGTHRAVTLEALRAGKPVLVEKPLAESEAAAREIVETARNTGMSCMVAQTLRREVLYRTLARALETRPGPVRIDYVFVLDSRADAVVRSLRAEDAQGRLFELGVHILDWLARLRPGTAGAVSCVAEPPPPRETRFTLRCRFPDLEAVASVTEQPAPRLERIRVHAGGDLWVGERFAHTLVRHTGGSAGEEPMPPQAPTLPVVVSEFVSACRGGVRIDAEDGLIAVRLAEACTRSALGNGQWVEVAI